MIEFTEDDIYYSYYTYEQIIGIISRVQSLSFTDTKEKEYLLKTVTDQKAIMDRYKLPIISAHHILHLSTWREVITDTGVVPTRYVSLNSGDYKVTTAKNLRRVDCCSNCGHGDTDYDGCTICAIHTQSDTRYEPARVEPLETFSTDICDDHEPIPRPTE
jgi:hypothetical protein